MEAFTSKSIDEKRQNSGKICEKLDCPKIHANFLSQFFHWWIHDLFRRGYKRPLTLGELYRVLPEDESNDLAQKLEKKWTKEIERARKLKEKPRLSNAIHRVFGKQFLIYSLLFLVHECTVKIAQPLALGALIKFFSDHENGSKSERDFDVLFNFNRGHLMALAIIGCSIFSNILLQPALFSMSHLSMKIRIACSALLYRKALRLSQSSLTKTEIGHMMTLLSSDLCRFDQVTKFLHYLWIAPIQVVISTTILWLYLGPSCLLGVGFLIAFFPIQIFISRRFSAQRRQTAEATARRIRIMSEIITGVKLIKMYTWEIPFSKWIRDARIKEMQSIAQTYFLRTINSSVFYQSCKLIVFLTFVLFVLLENELTTECVFISLALYNNIRSTMTKNFPGAMETLADVKVATLRLQDFFLLDEKNVKIEKVENQKFSNLAVSVQNVTAIWPSKNSDETKALENVNFEVKTGQLVAVIGRVGSGKSAILQTILKELSLHEGDVQICGKIGYAPQEPWLFDGSLKDNILFGSPFDPSWYKEVIEACALYQDIQNLPYGDNTFVGDRGAKLSGGQKARVGLARAVYSRADVLLLDDPLSAIDAHVGKVLFKKCINGILREKTRILVTHQLQYLTHSDYILVMKDGAVEVQGTFDELMQKNIDLGQIEGPSSNSNSNSNPAPKNLDRRKSSQSTKSSSTMNETGATTISKAPRLQLDLELEQDTGELQSCGSIGSAIYQKYFLIGSSYISLAFIVFLFAFSQFLYTFADAWLAMWAGAEENGHKLKERTNDTFATQLNPDDSKSANLLQRYISNDRAIHILGYLGILVLLFALVVYRTWHFFQCALRSSVNLHTELFQGIIRASMSFFDRNSGGRILSRFSKDLDTVDNELPLTIVECLDLVLNVVGTIILLAVINPILLLPSIFLGLLFYFLHIVYLRTTRSLKRLEGIARSPVFSHLASSVRGIVTIRAFREESEAIRQFDTHLNLHSAASFLLLVTNRWYCNWLEWITTLFIAIVTFSFLVFSGSSDAAVGLAVSSTLALSSVLQAGARQSAEVETQMVSVERVLEYSNITPEADLESIQDKKPPKNWPQLGKIQLENVSLTYAAPSSTETIQNRHYGNEDECVLKNLTFTIQPCEKIGIVGRTGAGKTSLISLLFRLTEPSGRVLIDDLIVNEKGFGLKDLRSRISIIPQDPILFSGSIRYNLDPFGQFGDPELWSVLEQVGVKAIFQSLDSLINDGGNNLSFGQRQLICVSRALLRHNRILIMDEVTSNVDLETDALIHKTVESQFTNSTKLIISHRLHSVMTCDRIMVLDDGRILEFDNPLKLLKQESSALRKLVDETGESMAKELERLAEQSQKKYL